MDNLSSGWMNTILIGAVPRRGILNSGAIFGTLREKPSGAANVRFGALSAQRGVAVMGCATCSSKSPKAILDA